MCTRCKHKRWKCCENGVKKTLCYFNRQVTSMKKCHVVKRQLNENCSWIESWCSFIFYFNKSYWNIRKFQLLENPKWITLYVLKSWILLYWKLKTCIEWISFFFFYLHFPFFNLYQIQNWKSINVAAIFVHFNFQTKYQQNLHFVHWMNWKFYRKSKVIFPL